MSSTADATRFSLLMNYRRNSQEVAFLKDDVEQSVPARFAKIVQQYSSRPALCSPGYRWTYADLDTISNAIANRILRIACGRRMHVGLLLGHDAPMVAAMFAALKSASVYVPLDALYPQERLVHMVSDSGIRLIITDNAHRDLARSLARKTIAVINLDDHDHEDSSEPPDVLVAADAYAYILYTSGSTGHPKGVIQTHRNILHHTRVWTHALGVIPDDRMTLLSSFSWDSAVQDTYGALLNGAASYPFAVKDQGFDKLAELLLDHELSICHATVPVYRYLVMSLSEKQKIPKLRVMALGAGMIFQRDIENYRSLFADDCVVVNAYGSTETTTAIIYSIDKQTTIPCYPIPIGYPVFSTTVELLGEDTKPVGVGEAGEITIASEHVAIGYLNKPDLTAEKFSAATDGSARRIYHTGDIGSMLEDGCLVLSGRKDDQVKIRGIRVEPGEVAAALTEHPDVSEVEVMALDHSSGNKRLATYFVSRSGTAIPSGELRAFLSSRLPEHMVPATFVQIDEMPLTPNKKVDRNLLPRPNWALRSIDQRFVAPGTPLQTLLTRIWTETLGLDRVGIEDNFFELGGDSLLGNEVVMRAERAGYALAYRDLFQYPTIAELAAVMVVAEPTEARCAGGETNAYHAPMIVLDDQEIERIGYARDAIEDVWPLSPTQQGIYTQCLLATKKNAPYLEQVAFTINGHLDVAAFAEAWRLLLQRHAALRIVIVRKGLPRPLQLVLKNVDFTIETLDYRDLSAAAQCAAIAKFEQSQIDRGIAFTNAPLLRVALIRLDQALWHFAWTYHHIVMDGWSEAVLIAEWLSIYDCARQGREITLPEARPFRDFLVWLEKQDMPAAEDFWRARLKGFASPIEWRDRQEDDSGTAGNEGYASTSSAFDMARCRSLCKAHGLTTSSLMQGLWSLILGELSGARDLVFGTVISGRQARVPGIASIAGLFVNTLPARVAIDPDAPLLPWVHSIQNDLAEMQHFGYSPLGDVQRWSEVPPQRWPIINSLFVFLNFPTAQDSLASSASLQLSERRFRSSPHYPLTLFVDPGQPAMLRLHYSRKLFGAEASVNILAMMALLVDAVGDNARRTLGELLGLLSAANLPRDHRQRACTG